MRRLLTIMIALVLSFSLSAPLFEASAATSVPACCRRSGAHHCMTMVTDQAADPAVSAIPNRCPRLPVSITTPQPHDFVPLWEQTSKTPLFVRPAALPQTEARYRVSFARSRQKRGPPAIL